MYKSYKKDVEEALDKGKVNGLIKAGMFLQGASSLLSAVDTGRLRASITYVVDENIGKIGRDKKGVTHSKDKPTGKGNKDTLYYGSNVEYAPKQEKIKSFLKSPLFNHKSKIQEMIQKEVERSLK